MKEKKLKKCEDLILQCNLILYLQQVLDENNYLKLRIEELEEKIENIDAKKLVKSIY